MDEHPVPEPVERLVSRHLTKLDQAAPGLVEMLFLTGSVALGDYRHGSSDVDFLAVTSRPLVGDELAAVARVRSGFDGPPHYDGIYLDRGELASLPDDGRAVPHIVGGEFRTDQPCGELNPVLWRSLAQCGIAMRGPAPAELGLRADPDRLRRWHLDNLRGYWRAWAEQVTGIMAERADDEPARPEGVVWTVLGPPRLHYTLATGEVTSKSGAGRYALAQFPEWADLSAREVAWGVQWRP